jgi:hypothetical protein
MLLRRVVSSFALCVILTTPLLHGRILRIEIRARAQAFNGQVFGAAGAYEQIQGTAYGEIDPADRRNAPITDILLAPRNSRGRVEYRTTFTMRKPLDMSKAAGVLFYNVVNRGNHQGTTTLHVGGDPGDGFLYKLGHVVLWSGWQGDLPIGSVTAAQEGIDVPVVKNADGSPVTGKVWKRFVNVADRANTQSLGSVPGREPESLDTAKARLISVVMETPAGVKSGLTHIADSDWAFADCRTVPFPGTPDATRICLKNGFDAALLYELVYTAKNPLAMGVGMAATRDLVSFFRYAEKDDAGTPNPVAGAAPHVVALGESQSGRFAKAFLNLGFNEDESGKIVWDGLNTHIAGMMGSFNVRFGVPGDMAELYDPGAEGPLWWGDYDDKVRGHSAWGLLHRCTASGTCPKITETYGGPEYWYSRGTVGVAGTTGRGDLALPENVRRYYSPGTAHGGGRGGFNLGAAAPGSLANNPNPMRETNRALYVALVEWVVKGTLPPPSAYPRVADGTLVDANSAAMGWPAIPNTPKPDGVMNPVLDYDYGPDYRYNDNSGVITNVPPGIKRAIATPAPKVDADGNEIAGVRSLLLRVPLGTYTGWIPLPSGALKGRERALGAGYIPFAKTKSERLASGDPRLSVAERYPNLWVYLEAAAKQAGEKVAQRVLLPEDATRLIRQLLAEMQASKLLPD